MSCTECEDEESVPGTRLRPSATTLVKEGRTRTARGSHCHHHHYQGDGWPGGWMKDEGCPAPGQRQAPTGVRKAPRLPSTLVG